MVGQLRKFVDVAFYAAYKAFQLRQYFVHVGGDFRHGPRQDVEVVVPVHLQFPELFPKRAFTRGSVVQYLLGLLRSPWRSELVLRIRLNSYLS
jgi:hypothetical protein